MVCQARGLDTCPEGEEGALNREDASRSRQRSGFCLCVMQQNSASRSERVAYRDSCNEPAGQSQQEDGRARPRLSASHRMG